MCSDADVSPEYQNPDGWGRLLENVCLQRTWGDCYGYLLLASGWADIMADPVLEVWDIAGIIPVIEGAGGKITDWQGKPAVMDNGSLARSAVAAHPAIHADIIALLN